MPFAHCVCGTCRSAGKAHWLARPTSLALAPGILSSQVLGYDYYGAYGHQARSDSAYGRLLREEYTFDFPPHQDVVSSRAHQRPWHSLSGFLSTCLGLRVQTDNCWLPVRRPPTRG